MKHIKIVLTLMLALGCGAAIAQEAEEKVWTSDEAWTFLKSYEYGSDWKPLLLIENEVEEANKTSETAGAMAERLAGYLTDGCTLPCRQFACMQLRMVGTGAQVPALAALLDKPEEFENARIALEVISGSESLAALRDVLGKAQGLAKVGLINSLAKRVDTESLPAIIEMTKSDDAAVKSAAVYALGKFGQAGLDALNSANFPVEDSVAGQAALTVAADFCKAGNVEGARGIYEKYAVDSAQRGCQKAALIGLLNLAGDKKNALITEWFTGDDELKVKLAAARLSELSADEFAAVSAKEKELSQTARIAFLEMAVEKEGDAAFDRLIERLASSDAMEQATAVRLLGQLGTLDAVPKLITLLASDNEAVASAAREAIETFPTDVTGPMLIEAMKKNGAEAAAAIDLLASLKYYEAIDPMIEQAKANAADVHEKAIDGLSKLADPDENDLPRLIKLYFHAAKNGYRDKVERAIVIVCKKSENAAEKIVAAVDKVDGKISDEANVLILPLLGKLGGEFAHNQIRAAMKNPNPQIAAAALRGFCNWPDAVYADELWTLATQGDDAAVKQMALRAYVRVVTLKSDRSAAETLTMLKGAFDAAGSGEDKTLILTRAAEIRDMAVVNWLFGFIDDEAFSQTVCASIAKMAHHRELREPNKAAFDPILEKVEKTAKDKSVSEAAKKARMGM